MEYKNSLNLPKTDFPIKANCKEVEEKILAFWDSKNISEKLLFSQDIQKKDKYILHDGPPYPNGDIHLGHALNKILKDIVVKFKTMEGYQVPFLPGWDCHGLPIETQLLKELDVRRSSLSVYDFRKKCAEYALKYVDTQKAEFKRLGVFGMWNYPYLTLKKEYESRVIELFGMLADKGYVFKYLKPIHWCPNCETALAEAEIEYEEHSSPSIFVKFRTISSNLQSQSTGGSRYPLPLGEGGPRVSGVGEGFSFIIWTTTPWTLPSNTAIALHPNYEYNTVLHNGHIFVIAKELTQKAAASMKWVDYKILKTFKGSEFDGIICRHPFLDRESPVVMDEFVSLEDGTGCVHIAPGHGEEDYKVGLKNKLPIIMPVNEKGIFTKEAGQFEGIHVFKANPLVIDVMKDNETLLYSEMIKHQYPHCWRCRKTVIFRATEQWFISIDHDDLREKVLNEIKNIKWHPAWGSNRISGMVKNRPDWCISRQRSWGIPIPAFYCLECGTPNFKGEFNKAVVDFVKKHGTDEWFKKEADEILQPGFKCEKCFSNKFRKETDIMDVWLESGASHFAVLLNNQDLFSHPADLYLEGSDQHRGWFQTSILTSIAALDKSPYKAVLTHGFTVDEKGKKMSKSLGNVIDPQDVVKEFGADVLRLWVASSDFTMDVAVSKKILKQINEGFVKIRNTCRFLLSNINNYDELKDKVEYKNLNEIDKYILFKLESLSQKVRSAYDTFEFHAVYHGLYSFCVNDLSAFYLDIVKDRLYCDKKDSLSRRSCQSAIHEILLSIVKMMAPILTFTAEDIFSHIKKTAHHEIFAESIYFEKFSSPNQLFLDSEIEKKWKTIIDVRGEAYKKIEELRSSKTINQSSECDLKIILDEEKFNVLVSVLEELPSIFLVSKVDLEIGRGVSVIASKTSNIKCARCWRHLDDVGKEEQYIDLCIRCSEVVGGL